MCIINNPVDEVKNTKLFVSKNTDNTRQITIYANIVDNKIRNNAMILPVPFIDSVIFHDLSEYSKLFDDCNNCFYKHETKSLKSFSYGFTTNNLEVFNVGSYKVSIAKKIEDLKRADPSVFQISNGAYEVLDKNYGKYEHVGYIICKLNEKKEKYHPFAYSHNIKSSILFIPTKHYHDHSKYMQNYSMTNIFDASQNGQDTKTADDWDHEVYIVNYENNNKYNEYLNGFTKKNDWIKSKCINLTKYGFELPTVLNFAKLVISGRYNNIDLKVKVY